MATQSPPALLSFDGSGIPQSLKDQNRWAPWKAVFNEKRGKYDKIPCNADHSEYGISTAAPERWASFDTALRAFKAGQPVLSGVGYVMTKPHGVVGVDLDNCVADGVVAPWALAVVASLDSYTELSPSGKGLRIFVLGEAVDWMNHQVGIEVYGGTAPRFLTITGTKLPGAHSTVRAVPAAALTELRAQYGREVRTAEIEAADMPELLPESLIPDLADLDVPYFVRDFLTSGEVRGSDRSDELHAAGIALYQAGLADQEVFSVLTANPYVMEVALDHRRQDTDRATLYVWKEHCQKAKVKAEARRVSADLFDDISEPTPEGAETVDPLAGFEDISAPEEKAAKPQKQPRFAVQDISDFLKRPKANWLIKGVLPQAGLAVVFGESGSGKTFFVLDLTAAIARGIEWRGHKTRQGRVVYVCAEGEAGFRNRLDAYVKHNGLDGMPMGVIPDAPNLLEKTDVKDLLAALKAHGKVDVIVLDTFAQVMPGANENSGEDVGRALAHCKAIHRVTGALVILVHHSGKDSSKGARGWSGLRAAADAEIEVERCDHNRSATVTKLKDGEDGAEFGFKLETITIGEDDDGDTTSSCVITHGKVVRKEKEPAGSKQKVVMRVMRDLTETPGEYVSTNAVIENAIAQIPHDEAEGKRDRRRQHVLQAVEALVASGTLRMVSGQICINEQE